ncbi:pyruvate carboxylase [Halodesulfovibrio spirochaetisodalis]|uniref:Pyruvate carboxylase n=1 Tax=Halodesulfovibrio spirochaetisodalis TaxID=1560234 RepID=A0A1B7XBL5_9BACT|nr:pyruvate carboxylase [Halodesulfovibrio spirochaetisodalis]OBQ50140.1 pyruvate carboxylase [Halodesulfovibrio spirochaetisodalis]
MAIKTFNEIMEEVKGKPILVANRGIPARRICRSIRERFDAVAVMTATDIDKTSPAASAAQELLLLGSDPRAYLDIDRIISLAKKRGVVAIHPGWGFASEDHKFPTRCAEEGIIFIGSTAESMNLLGNKVQVRALAQKLGVPVVPGSDGSVDIPTARKFCEEIGFPIMLKAEGGGGGRGIFLIKNQDELESAFVKASTMAQASFGNPRLYIEKFLASARHIEIQVISDKYGNVFAFDERDCSIQRNHQKLVEITPSPSELITPELRARLKEYSRSLVTAVGYDSLATVEFLVTPDGEPYLIEVNTRLQVEHGITEVRYGVDLVEEQIAVAFGAELRLKEEKFPPSQMAMQLRINCEDPQDDFAPNCGVVSRYISPGGPGIRIDSNLSAGYDFPSNYDSAGALLISYGRGWKKVLGTMERALNEYSIGGLKTTIPFFKQVIRHPKFRQGDFDTNFIGNTPELLCYTDLAPEAERISKLIAEISAKGTNPYVQLGEYRSKDTPRVGEFNPVMPAINNATLKAAPAYPQGDRKALLDFVRDTDYVHFCDTTPRDITQSNSGNRFRLAEDKLIGPYLDNCGFFSIENGGGAHFHVAMLANMTYPFTEAKEWNQFAPKTLKQILIRSTNVLGYKPQPQNLMRATGEMICDHYDVIRCFDFLNHVENMRPFAEVALNRKEVVFEPAISLSWAKGFDVKHYLQVTEAILAMVADVAGVSTKKASEMIILGLKDMAGVCPPRFMTELITAIRKQWPSLVTHYHRHYTDGLFVPTVGAAAKAGAHIVDTGMGAAVRWYGQGEVLSTAAYIEEELGLKTNLNKDMIRECNFVLKQVMPYYDKYTAPFFQGIDHDVVHHAMPGGATSSSQEGALKQGYIHLLPYMLKFLAGTRQVVRYHDVTPGSQITWNTAFLAVTNAYKRGGEEEVRYLLEVLEHVTKYEEKDLSEEMKEARLAIYQDSNDAFRDLLLGKFGKLPLGFPADWVYQSAFGAEWKQAINQRTEVSPLSTLEDINLAAEESDFINQIRRKPTDEEFVMFLNHPADALKTVRFKRDFGNPNNIPLDVWFEGLETGRELHFVDDNAKPHSMTILHVSEPAKDGKCVVRYVLDSDIMSYDVQVATPQEEESAGSEKADPNNPLHVAAPSNGDLWVMYVNPGDVVKKGEELFNVSIMKQEKAVLCPADAMVKRVLKTADYKETKMMVPVKEGDLLIELGPIPRRCSNEACQKPLSIEGMAYCHFCGEKLEA